MLGHSTHMGRVGGDPTKVTKIIIRTILLQWPLSPHAEHTIVFLDSACCAAEPVPDDVPG